MERKKLLKKALAIILCVNMITNNTLPILADSYENIIFDETTTIEEINVGENIVSPEEETTEIESVVVVNSVSPEEETTEIESIVGANSVSPELEETEIETTYIEEPEFDETETSESETEKQETESTEETNETRIEATETTETTETEISESETTETETIASDSEIKIEEETTIDENLELDIATPSELNLEVMDIATPSELDLGLVNIATLSELDLVIELATASEIEERLIPNSFIQEDIVAPIVEDLSIGDGDNVMYRASSLPTKYDSRQQTNSSTGLSYIPPVRDQYPFGTCWAFSTLAMFESSLRKKGLVKTETESNLSEAALAYFAYGLENVTNNSTYKDTPGLEGHDFVKIKNGDFASRGGNQLFALFTASAYSGVVSENSDTSYSRLASYQGKETQYTLNKKYAFNSNNFLLENAYILNKANIDIVKQKIIDNGAVGISYWSDNVYMHKTGSEYYYYTNIYSATNHGIAIVGWDDSIPAERFWTDYDTTRTGAKNPGGWLCRNSWGEDWALSNKGYFWISYEEPSLSSNIYAVDAIKADTYKYNYHYDTTGYVAATSQSATSTDQGAFANVFKGPEDKPHLLEAASVAINSTNTVLSIDVYVNNRMMDNPTDGTLKSTVTIERSAAGIYTIPLKDKVLLEKGSYFSIIVRGYSKNSNAKSLSIFYDTCATVQGTGEDAGNPISYYNSADVGQSFSSMYNTSNKSYYSWNDMNPYVIPLSSYPNDQFGNNYRIKGLANPVETIKVTFNSDGGNGTMSELDVVSNLDTRLPKNIFTKTGYKFTNWVDQNGNEYSDGATINTKKSLALKAVWTPIKYTIKYNVNGGTMSTSQVKKTYGTNVTLETPTKQGYNFLGWYKESALTNKYDGTTDITTNDNVNVNLYAKWSPITYTITYDLKGVSATKPANINKTYLVNVTLAQPTNVQSGCKFVAWYKDSALRYQYTGTEDLSTTQGATITIYAKWKQEIIFDANGHGYAPASREATVGNISLPSISTTGYTFAGWYNEPECRNLIGLAGASYYVTGPKTLYAKWIPITYTINYNANGGSISSSTGVKTYGTNLVLLRPGRNNYDFKGWYKDSSLKAVYDGTTDLTTVNGSTITIYAKWEPKSYKVTLNTYGGTIISGMVKEYTYGIGAILPTNIKSSREGYEFSGWYDNPSFTGNKITNISKTTSGDKTYYAQYMEAYTITFDPGTGTGTMSAQKVFNGGSVVLNKNKFTKSGYKFNLWAGSDGKTYSDGETIPNLTSNLTLKANWIIDKQSASSGNVNHGGGSSGGSGGSGGGGGGGGAGGGGRISSSVLANDDGPNKQITQNNQVTQKNQVAQNSNNPTRVSIFRAYTNIYNSSSATWVSNESNGKWKLNVQDSNGQTIHPSNGFIQLDGYKTIEENNQKKEVFASDTYFFDENGDMVTGWLQTSEGKVYYFNTENNSEIGKMAFGWKEIGGVWYCFAFEGALYKNTTTPDGYVVDENGKLVK